MTPRLSIVVCTFNRATWLRICLESLVPQCVDASMVEVLIVDNNSTDDTTKVASEFTVPVPNFRYVFEQAQGLSHARNRGFREARGDYVAYIDDDAKAHPDWVNAILQFINAYPDVSGFGGQHRAFSLVPIPSWFPKEYGSRTMGEVTRPLQEGEWISGTNMVFKKSALSDVGGFNTSIGMTGTKVSYGEEVHLTLRMIERGMQIYYCAKMRVDHAIREDKLTLRWLLHSSFAGGYDAVTILSYKGTAITFLPILARYGVHACIALFINKEKHLKTRIYQSMAPFCRQLGHFVKLLGL